MFRTFVVPLDGSDLAERALPYAVRLAQARRGRLVLLDVALAPPPMQVDLGNYENLPAQAVDDARAYLSGVADKLATRVPVDISVRYGRAANEILDEVA